MSMPIDHTRLHRTAKYFMDSGKAATHAEAMDLLRGFSAAVCVGPEVAGSAAHQIALLTFVNVARRTFLDGIHVVGLPDARLLVPLAAGKNLAEAVVSLGGKIAEKPEEGRPAVAIGTANAAAPAAWQLTWQGWRGGVVPPAATRLAEDGANALAPALAAAIAAAEMFAWHAGDHPMAGKRSAGLSLWQPGADWLKDAGEPALAYLPSRLWLIGLGNLGQAFAWLIACLPYADRRAVELMLQDFDRIAESNDSTSMLSSLELVGAKKTRAVGGWLERAGFDPSLEERRFGEWTRRAPHEPGVALCGVDNALARASLGKAGFDLIVEAGLGGGPDGFRNFSMHSFPASRTPEEIWPSHVQSRIPDVSDRPAYAALKNSGLDACGLVQLASRTVGVPFVGLIAAAVAVSEPLRRLHGANGIELVSGSAAALSDLEAVGLGVLPFPYGHVPI
jgi:hypothetical protein